MPSIKQWLGGLTVVCALGLAGTAIAADIIKIGIVLPLTGEQAKFGEIEKRSFEMAAEEINAAGGIKGQKLQLLFEDDTGKPDVGRSATEKLISQDKVPVLTGGYSSSVTAAATAVAQQLKVPFLVTTGSADDITEKGYDFVFRINPPASEYPLGLSSFLEQVAKPKTAVILFENSLFGQSSSKEMVSVCEKLGIQVLLKEGYNKGAIDFKPLLTKVKAQNPDLVYMVSYVMDASLVMRQAKELNLNAKLFMGGGAGFTLPEFAKSAGPAADYVYSATLWMQNLPYPDARKYFDAYQAKFKEETEYHGAEAYASMQVIGDALKRAKSLSSQDIRDALAATDTKTVFGPVKFVSYGKKTQQNRLPTFLVQWQNGKLETVWPTEIATTKYKFPIPPWNERK
jgi:branched-chain amino acid transport system substrate-binding protein